MLLSSPGQWKTRSSRHTPFFSDARIWNWKLRCTRKHFFRRYSSRLLRAVTPTGLGTENSNCSDLPIPGDYRFRPLQSVCMYCHTDEAKSMHATTPSYKALPNVDGRDQMYMRLFLTWFQISDDFLWNKTYFFTLTLYLELWIQSDQWFCMANKRALDSVRPTILYGKQNAFLLLSSYI